MVKDNRTKKRTKYQKRNKNTLKVKKKHRRTIKKNHRRKTRIKRGGLLLESLGVLALGMGYLNQKNKGGLNPFYTSKHKAEQLRNLKSDNRTIKDYFTLKNAKFNLSLNFMDLLRYNNLIRIGCPKIDSLDQYNENTELLDIITQDIEKHRTTTETDSVVKAREVAVKGLNAIPGPNTQLTIEQGLNAIPGPNTQLTIEHLQDFRKLIMTYRIKNPDTEQNHRSGTVLTEKYDPPIVQLMNMIIRLEWPFSARDFFKDKEAGNIARIQIITRVGDNDYYETTQKGTIYNSSFWNNKGFDGRGIYHFGPLFSLYYRYKNLKAGDAEDLNLKQLNLFGLIKTLFKPINTLFRIRDLMISLCQRITDKNEYGGDPLWMLFTGFENEVELGTMGQDTVRHLEKVFEKRHKRYETFSKKARIGRTQRSVKSNKIYKGVTGIARRKKSDSSAGVVDTEGLDKD
jgi:hypothetical protein